MKATNSQKIRTGIFALVGIGMLVVAVFLIGRTKNMFGATFHIYGTFKNVGGLQAGNNVRFVGINVGTVQSIKIVSDTLARVDMIIDKKAHQFIKESAVASIGSDGLMGDKLIVISATSEGGEVIADGHQINTQDPIDFSKTMVKVNQIAENAQVVTEALANIATDINKGKGTIGRLLYNDKLAKNLEGTVESIKEGSEGFSENMQALKSNVLFRGYYKKKEKEKQARVDSAQQAHEPSRAERRKMKKEEKAAKKAQKRENAEQQ